MAKTPCIHFTKIDISINIVVRMAMLQTYHVSNGFNCISKCTILQCFHPIHWFPFLFFSFFTIQLTKLQVILSFEEEFASIIRSTINKHDTPRNTLLSRNRKNEKKVNMTHIPPILIIATFYQQQAKQKPSGNIFSHVFVTYPKFSDSFFILQIYILLLKSILSYY